MKLVFFILAITVAINADPIPGPTRSDLENLAKLIVDTVENAPDSIDKFVVETKKQIKEELLKNDLVKRVQVKLNKKLESKEITAECSASVDQHFGKLVNEVYDDFMKTVALKRFGKQDDYLNTLKSEMSQLKNVLKDHLDEEIESCLAGKSKCKLNQEYLGKAEEYFFFTDIVERVTPSLIQSSTQYFDSLETGNKIVVHLTLPSHECLSN